MGGRRSGQLAPHTHGASPCPSGVDQVEALEAGQNQRIGALIPRPSSPDRALRWLKAALGRRGLQGHQVDKLSWHSFRVFIPDCAFQLRIPRDQRQYLGNWTTESTADIYTREKRNVVTRVWEEVALKLPSLNLGGARLVREDLDHPDWEDPMVVTIDDAGTGQPSTPPGNAHQTGAGEPGDSPPETTTSTDTGKHKQLGPRWSREGTS